jgi:Putative zinc-finger
MQEISSLLRQRLAARQAPQTHPDPDLLTAYVEQALGETERAQVVQHLAACSHCREVVSLSLPEQPAQPVLPAPADTRFWLPAFRWTAVAATIGIAAALVIEKPWHKTSGSETQAERQVSIASPAPASLPPSDSVSRKEPPVAAAGGSPAQPTTSNQAAQASLGLVASEKQSERIDSAHAKAPRITTGAIGNVAPLVASAAEPSPPLVVRSTAPPPAREAQFKDSNQSDYVNKNLLKNQSTVEVSAEAPQVDTSTTDGAALPPAPAPKAGAGGKVAPSITNGQLGASAFDYKLQPPQTGPSASSPTPDKNTLDTMSFTAKVTKKIKEGAKGAMAKLGTSQPPPMAREFSNVIANPDSKQAEADQDVKRDSLQFHWRLTADGILMKSTDLSQWHEAYPQGADLQFRSFFTAGQGRQVWAGGNNGTLVHSWNGGVNWDTLKVPEAGGSDITAISVDDGWQVKTSNGQTFVSHDQGKTWVPLKQN